MNETNQRPELPEHWPYQVDLLSIAVRWLTIIAILGAAVNSLWFLWDPWWRPLTQNTAILLAAAIGWQCRRLAHRGYVRRAIRLFLGTGFGISGLVLVTLGELFVLNGVFLLAMFMIIGIFSLPRGEARLWNGGSILVTWLALSLRYFLPLLEYELIWPDMVAVYIFSALVLGSAVLLGDNIAQRLYEALAESLATHRTLEQQAAQLAQYAANLEASEQKYRTIFAASPDITYLTDIEGNVLEANPALLKRIGIPLTALQTMNVADFLTSTDSTPICQAMAKLKQGQAVKDFEIQARDRHGQLLTYQINAIPLSEAGKITKVLNVARDITARKQMEQALQASERKYRAYVENATEGLSVCHNVEDFPYVQFTVWNERMTDLTGYTMSEINQQGWYQTVYPDPDLRQRASERMARMRHGDNLVAEAWEITRKDGQRRILSISTTLLAEDDGSSHVLALMYDLTERRQMEVKLRETKAHLEHILITSPITIYSFDLRRQKITFISENIKNLLGYEARQFMDDDEFWFNHLHPEDRATYPENFTQLMELGQHVYNYRFLHQDGNYRWMHDATRVHYDEQNQPKEMVGAWSDVTAQVEADNARQRYAERLRILHDIDQAILMEHPSEIIAQTALRGLLSLIAYHSGGIVLFDHDTGEGEILATETANAGYPTLPLGKRLSLATFSGLADNNGSLMQGQPYLIDDLQTVPYSSLMVQVLQDMGLRSVVVAPLIWHQDTVGVLSLGSGTPNFFTAEHIEITQEVGHSLAVAIQQDRLQQERQQHLEQLKISLQEKEVLLKEIHHRVKNNMQVISSLLYLQGQYVSTPETRTAFQESRDRIQSMALVHEQLYQTGNLAAIDFQTYLNTLLVHISGTYRSQSSQAKINLQAHSVDIDISTAITLGLIVNELVANAFKYAFPDNRVGQINIELTMMRPDTYQLIVCDDGVGFPPEIAARLDNEGLPSLFAGSLGMKLVDTLVQQLEGNINVHANNGVRYEILIPLPG